jgi:hypothetical protein
VGAGAAGGGRRIHQDVHLGHVPALSVPTRRDGCISLDFLGLLVARSGHDFMQVHIDLRVLTCRVWLRSSASTASLPRSSVDALDLPTFKTATLETAANNLEGYMVARRSAALSLRSFETWG